MRERRFIPAEEDGLEEEAERLLQEEDSPEVMDDLERWSNPSAARERKQPAARPERRPAVRPGMRETERPAVRAAEKPAARETKPAAREAEEAADRPEETPAVRERENPAADRSAVTEENSPAPEESLAVAAEEVPHHRRRRTERFAEEERMAAEPPRPAEIRGTSETAREVANRYAQRQPDSMGDTMRIPVRSSGRPGAARPASGRGREQVGYASGRMGMSAGDRARMSEAGRARLAEEMQERGTSARNPREAIHVTPQWDDGRDPGYGGRPAVPAKRNAQAPRKSRKGLTVAVVALLAVGALLAGLLLLPEEGPLGSVRRLLNPVREEPHEVLAFSENGQETREDGTDVLFYVQTERGVSDVRLLDAEGNILTTSRSTSWGETPVWDLIWHTDAEFSGVIRLQILAGENWMDTDRSLEVRVLPRVTTEPELPEVVATETPAPTPEPTPTPAPTAAPEVPEDEEDGDAEREGTGEDAPAAAYEEEPAQAEEPAAPGNDGAEEAALTAEAAEEEPAWFPEDAEGMAEPAEEAPAEDAPAAEPAAAEPVAGGETADGGTPEETPRPLLTVSAAESADPKLISASVIYNGTKKVAEYARSDKEKIHMPTLGEYTKQKIGVLTFRSDAFRQNAAVGTVTGTDSLAVSWKAEAGSVRGSGQTYYGIGWVGQPAIVKWSKEVREQSDLYTSKQEKSGLKEVIVAGLDGRIYFLDLADGTATRNSIKLGYPMKAAPSVHPGGAPYLTVGQFARKMASKTGTIGLRQYNLYLMKELSLIDGLDAKRNRPYNKVGSFETSALIDRTTGTLVTAGTNGMLYVINLNAEFDYNSGTYNQSPATVLMKSKAKGEKDTATAVEASVAMYDRYVYYADMGGYLRCVDTNTMTTAWAVALGDAVESTPALDWHGEDGLDLYTATLLSSRKKGDAEVKCFDALTGEERWSAAFGVKKDTKGKTVSGFRASPVVGQNGLADYVYYAVNNLSDEGRESLGLGEGTAALVALRKEDGSVAWAHELTGLAYSSPVAVYDEAGNGAVIQCAGDGTVRMLDGLTGEEKAFLQIDGAIEASPAVYDGMMVVGTTEKNKNNIYGIRIE